MKQARYLIIGASGFIGSHLYSTLGSDKAIATYKTKPMDGGIYFDPASMRLADTILRDAPCLTHAFLLYAMSNIDECARNPQVAYRINVESQQRIIDELFASGIMPVYASSDAVFDGTRGMWCEHDEANPVLTYGCHKAQIEKYLTDKSQACQILRLSKIVSTSPGDVNLLNDWMQALEQESEIRCAYDQIFSPADVDDVIAALIQLADNNDSGIFHVCGPQPISRLEFVRTLEAKVRRHRAVMATIIPCSIRDFKFAEPRPFDASMSPRKLYAVLGREFKGISAICERAAARRYLGKTSVNQGPVNR